MDSRLLATPPVLVNEDHRGHISGLYLGLDAPGPDGIFAAEVLITVSASVRREAYQVLSSPVRPN